MALVKPVDPLVLPSDLIGVPNGSVPANLLSPCGVISAYSPHAEMLMHHLASRAMHAMMAAAAKAMPGFTIRATSTLRSYNAQVVAFDGTNPASRTAVNGRYIPQAGWADYVASGGKFVEEDVKLWPGHGLWKRRAGTAMAAVPGTSNHGLALAIDYESIPLVFTLWLIVNARTFGYSAEAQSEDWHWRYNAGDNLPQAVLDYENPSTPPGPVPPVYDEDMPTLYRDSRYNNVFLVNGDVTTVGPNLFASLTGRNVPVVVDLHDQSLISYMRKSQIKTGQLVPSGTPGPFNAPADLIGD